MDYMIIMSQELFEIVNVEILVSIHQNYNKKDAINV